MRLFLTLKPEQPSDKSSAYNIGYSVGAFIGQYWIPMLLLLVIAILLLFIRKRAGRKR